MRLTKKQMIVCAILFGMAAIERITEEFLARGVLSKEDFVTLIDGRDAPIGDGAETPREILRARAAETSQKIFGKKIYARALIEFTNFCKNNCYYCGIRAGNSSLARYRLSMEETIALCDEARSLGFRTFVLQGGEDVFFTDEKIAALVREIKARFPECALTLSIGERKREAYALWRAAGADRYLLRHETADASHYARLHPREMSLENRKRCLRDLKALGYQTGAGFMVGSPFQTTENLASDLLYLRALSPEMIGIGPFIHHDKTPFAREKDGSVELTLFLISVLRVMFPRALIPATTALGTLCADGRERGILCGANVVMPNFSPAECREKYALYNGKAAADKGAEDNFDSLKRKISATGYEVAMVRGDYGE